MWASGSNQKVYRRADGLGPDVKGPPSSGVRRRHPRLPPSPGTRSTPGQSPSDDPSVSGMGGRSVPPVLCPPPPRSPVSPALTPTTPSPEEGRSSVGPGREDAGWRKDRRTRAPPSPNVNVDKGKQPSGKGSSNRGGVRHASDPPVLYPVTPVCQWRGSFRPKTRFSLLSVPVREEGCRGRRHVPGVSEARVPCLNGDFWGRGRCHNHVGPVTDPLTQTVDTGS